MLKVVNPLHTKLVKRLRDGSSKIIYICNRKLRATQKDVKYIKNISSEGMRNKTAGLLKCV